MKRWPVAAYLLLLSLETSCSLGQKAADVPCYKDSVQTSPGVVIDVSSGQTYQVYPTDNHISMIWLPLDKLIVCPIGGGGVEMTNLTRKGEKIRAIRIYNWFWLNQVH